MIRRQTIVLLVIFAVLVGLTVVLQRNPQVTGATETPSPTAAVQLLEGIQASDITSMEFRDKDQAVVVQVLQNSQGEWLLGTGDPVPASTGAVEQARTQIEDLQVLVFLDASIDSNATGLATPAHWLALRTTSGRQNLVKIGDETPTRSGYYIQVDDNPPVIVNRYSIDNLLDALTVQALASPNPDPATNLQPTTTP